LDIDFINRWLNVAHFIRNSLPKLPTIRKIVFQYSSCGLSDQVAESQFFVLSKTSKFLSHSTVLGNHNGSFYSNGRFIFACPIRNVSTWCTCRKDLDQGKGRAAIDLNSIGRMGVGPARRETVLTGVAGSPGDGGYVIPLSLHGSTKPAVVGKSATQVSFTLTKSFLSIVTNTQGHKIRLLMQTLQLFTSGQ